ncbi:uncharacterized protein LOC122084668 [Macadamia integrifolia]|uniref:uncharacterized protein LOC122084668 n=1 Tax=Macadamia integrifolia TaxID=60698 RepID=UPI001C4F52A7|nr:uncharacterized protein LOC122084668 [Macadamia integrifolia]
MGNGTSCAPTIISGGAVKVLSSDGRLEVYTRPIKAAELMLENPRQFVCNSNDLKVGHRITGLAADEELERRRLYFILPMDILYSVLTDEEMFSLSYKASRAMKHGSSSNNIVRIFPVFGDFCMFPSEVKTLEESTGRKPQPTERLSRQRSWKPALDTILETPSWL